MSWNESVAYDGLSLKNKGYWIEIMNQDEK